MQAITFRTATQTDWPALADLLSTSKLPTDGARDHLDSYLLAFRGDELVASAGLELYGDVGLLRSVAVDPSGRSTGLGQGIVLRRLEAAYENGLKSIILLTTTADKFFPRFGFTRITREEAPSAVLASPEFRGVCPSSAVVMALDLSRPPMLVRPATPADVPAITRIYNQGIEDRSTLETALRTEEERLAWLSGRSNRHPVTVAVQQGEVVGWASINSFNPRDAYRFVGDLSVYVERGARRRGIGKRLMLDIAARARALDYHKLVLTTFPHLPAVKLYESLGYRHVGDYKEQGWLDGSWVDTRIMELIL